jgi:hypothetical protein
MYYYLHLFIYQANKDQLSEGLAWKSGRIVFINLFVVIKCIKK